MMLCGLHDNFPISVFVCRASCAQVSKRYGYIDRHSAAFTTTAATTTTTTTSKFFSCKRKIFVCWLSEKVKSDKNQKKIAIV